MADMKRMAESHFRHLDPDKREESIQNALTLAWKFLYALLKQGRDYPAIWKGVTWFAIRQTKSGRMVQGQVKAKDAFECRRHGRVRFECVDLNGLIGRKTPVFDQVVFRVDVRQFLGTLTLRNQSLAGDLATGMTTTEAAEKYDVTPGAIAQFRAGSEDGTMTSSPTNTLQALPLQRIVGGGLCTLVERHFVDHPQAEFACTGRFNEDVIE